jgi:hypothetical protein
MARSTIIFSVLALVGALVSSGGSSASAAEQTFPPEGKVITMLVGSESGGGTDASGRLIARYLGKYLRSEPKIVVQNMPGAGGLTALNYAVRTPPDGLIVVMGSSSTVDPLTFRKANVLFDPTKFRIIGGIGRGGTVLIISGPAEKRLYDKSLSPVIMGSNADMPRQGMQVALWGAKYLGWNLKWVVGYPGTNDLMLAMDRKEIDMTSTGNIFVIADRLKSGELKIINQSGVLQDGHIVGRKDFEFKRLADNTMKGFDFISPTAMIKVIKALGNTSDDTLLTTKKLNANMQ